MTQLTDLDRICLGCRFQSSQYGCNGDIDFCSTHHPAVVASRTFVSDGDPFDVSEMATRVGFKLPVFIGPKLNEIVHEIPTGHWYDDVDGRLVDILQAGLTILALSREGPHEAIPFTAPLHYQAEGPKIHETIKLLLSHDVAPWDEELSVTIALAETWTPPSQDPAPEPGTPLDLAVKAYQGRPSKENAHQYVPPWAAALLPPLYGQEGLQAETVVYLKYFTPDSSFTFYVLETDQETGLCFGLVDGHDQELGYFSLVEITQVRGKLGLKIERDLYWCPRTLVELRESI